MPTFLDHFKIAVDQDQVEFLNLDLSKDTKLFIDTYAVAMSNNEHCMNVHKALKVFMKKLLNALKSENDAEALALCSHFPEPTGTGIGWTKKSFKGRGAGEIKASTIVDALKSSEAVVSGAIEDLEELILTVDNVAHDTISDMTINIGLDHFIRFTQEQCLKLKIPMKLSKTPFTFFSADQGRWVTQSFELPHAPTGSEIVEEPIILLPKDVLRRLPTYGANYFFTNIATPFFIQNLLTGPASSFIRALKSGGYKADLRAMRKHEQYKGGKKRMSKFIKNHPEFLKRYREVVASYRLDKTRLVFSS